VENPNHFFSDGAGAAGVAGPEGAFAVAVGVVPAFLAGPALWPPQPSVNSPRLNSTAQAKNRFIVSPFL